MSPRALPDYARPPAVETVLGVRFSPIQGWNVFHYGLLLPKFKEEYPKQQLRPPLGAVTTIQVSTDNEEFAHFPVRAWFINQDDTQLVQVQNDCFIRNWRKTAATPDYLHYDVIRPLFQRDWAIFRDFLKEQNLPPNPAVWQCEVTYINQFVRGKDWNDYKDLQTLYPAWKGLASDGLFDRPETLMFSLSYALPQGAGSLQFVSQPGIRRSDGAEIIQLTITALGRPKGSDESDIMEWLDIGRSSVVRGFAGFTGEDAQMKWGKK
jgi:uncharacterized protein (TIGR04255 family)